MSNHSLAFRVLTLILLVIAVRLGPLGSQELGRATGRQAMVATVHPLATNAALEVIDRGGNAIDAAVMAGLMLGVVDGHNSGIGGGCFLLIHAADGTVTAIDGRETAPGSAQREMFFRDGQPDTQLSQTGPLASGVPGALAAYDLALRKYGRRQLSELLEQAAEVASAGFVLNKHYASRISATRAALAKYPATAAIFLKPDGQPLAAGDRLIQADLATTYRSVAKHGLPWFYGGPFAEQTAAWMRAHGGILTVEDFARYQALQREPIESTYRDYNILGFPPPSSGGIHVAQILNVLQHFDLATIYRQDRVAWYHHVAEAMKLAFADRAFWLGDPAFTKVPRGLIDPAYARQLAAKIDPHRATAVAGPGTPDDAAHHFFGKHTTHLSTADDEGNWVALTQTINTTFGSKVIVPGLGVLMNNEMDDFAIAPGVANAFGLVGSQANEIAPGKRPLSSMSPTIVLHKDRPVMSLGAAGGPRIITQTVSLLLRRIDLQMPFPAAISAPRLHHQWRPDSLWVTDSLDEETRQGLRDLGHDLKSTGSLAVVQGIEQVAGGVLLGVRDPEVPGLAAGR